mmetsp:Transcript_60562/g.189697  ORF Transcript_60562/g.189697 Transcript_60562/m.189697 type:complete len:220 (-) Transcript_60562:538-1197(-)
MEGVAKGRDAEEQRHRLPGAAPGRHLHHDAVAKEDGRDEDPEDVEEEHHGQQERGHLEVRQPDGPLDPAEEAEPHDVLQDPAKGSGPVLHHEPCDADRYAGHGRGDVCGAHGDRPHLQHPASHGRGEVLQGQAADLDEVHHGPQGEPEDDEVDQVLHQEVEHHQRQAPKQAHAYGHLAVDLHNPLALLRCERGTGTQIRCGDQCPCRDTGRRKEHEEGL